MIKIIVSFILVGIITLNSNFLWAKEELSLNSLIEQALKENPQLQAAKFRLEAAKARVRLLRTLEDPRFEYEYNKIIPGMISGATGENMSPMRMFSVSQEIPFPSKLFLRKKSAEKEANSFEQEYKETERKVIQEVKEAYFEIFLSHKKIAITKENLGLLKQFVEIANRKYSVNKASQQDSLKAQVEYSKLSNQLILLEQEEQISQARLKSLLSQPQESAYIKVEEESSAVVELSEEKIIKLTKDKRPELKAYSEMSRKAEIDLALAKQEYLPDFMVKYTREERNGSAALGQGCLARPSLYGFGRNKTHLLKKLALMSAWPRQSIARLKIWFYSRPEALMLNFRLRKT